MVQRKSLDKSWKFTQVSSELFPNAETKWQSCEVPTSVHVELIKEKRIPDPFKGLAEWDVQCKSSFHPFINVQGLEKPTGCLRRLSTMIMTMRLMLTSCLRVLTLTAISDLFV